MIYFFKERNSKEKMLFCIVCVFFFCVSRLSDGPLEQLPNQFDGLPRIFPTESFRSGTVVSPFFLFLCPSLVFYEVLQLYDRFENRGPHVEWGLLTTEVESELKRLEKYISLLKKKKKTRKNRKQKMSKEFHTTSSKKLYM